MKELFKMVLVMMILISSCNNCEPWGKKSARSFQKMKNLYNNDSVGFQHLDIVLSKYLKTVDSSHAEYVSWDKDSLNKISDLDLRNCIAAFFSKNGIRRVCISNNSRVYFYPIDSSENSQENDNCPYYSYEILYVANQAFISGNVDSSSPNFIFYKIADHWFLRTGVASM